MPDTRRRWVAPEAIARIAAGLGFQVQLEPGYRYVGRLVAPDGRCFYFRNTNFDLNGQGAAEVARDKAYAAYFMRLLGYPAAEGETFYSDAWCRVVGSDRNIDAAYRWAADRGFPVIVKPNSKSHGAGVAKVYNRREFYRAMRAVFHVAGDRVALVQPFLPGDDHRIVVLDGAVMAAYRRIPLSVVGDGHAPVRALLARREQELAAQGRPVILDPRDYRLLLRLRRLRLTLDSVPPAGRRVVLRDNANLSTGGEAEDVTDRLHPGYQALAAALARDMGLRHCGVDLLTRRPIDQPPSDYTVLEVNPAPGLDHYARLGAAQQRRVEAMYQQILLALSAGPVVR